MGSNPILSASHFCLHAGRACESLGFLGIRMSDDASQQAESLSIIFRCAPEHQGVVPPPIPAVQGLPDWFKAMPPRAFSDTLQLEQMTVKRCPPFIDAMT